MNKTFRIAFSLQNTYRVNSILYGFKQIPLIKKLLPVSLYQVKGLKIFANILNVIWEVFTALFGKLLFFLLGIVLMIVLRNGEAGSQLFLHIFVCLTLIGAFGNTFVFNPTKGKYYALILMRMDAKEYTLSQYAYFLLKLLVSYALFGYIFGSLYGLAIVECLLLPLSAMGIKSAMIAYSLWKYKRTGIARNENKGGKLYWITVCALVVGAYGLPCLNIMLPQIVSVAILVASVVAGILSVKPILVFDEYYEVQRQILVDMLHSMNTGQEVVREQNRNMISVSTQITSRRKGYEYLNELFVKRHHKILWKASKLITMISLLILAGALVLMHFASGAREGIQKLIMQSFPYFVFIMYSINRGAGFTRALFANCDHCLLTYSFYKQPKPILKLFQIRLRELIKINLLPALVIALGLDLLVYVSGGTDQIVNYVILFVTIIALSIFFSVHNLTIYYLLQPYNVGTEIKSGMYQVVMWVTYFISFIFIYIRLPLLSFGILASIFCIAYCIIACGLVYRLAPKTFRLRQ